MDVDREQEVDTGSQEPDIAYFRPMPSRKVWVILVVIFVTIAVAILYVYQAGDRKTVLGNQPIPANRDFMRAQPMRPVALNVPGGGGLNMPAASAASGGPAVRCPHCHTLGLPLCGSCGTVMRPLPGAPGSGLYVCPSCGRVGLPICPRCGARMTSPGGVGRQSPARPAGLDIGGQFQCPVCGAVGLPNWDPDGTPVCPRCGARMRVNQGGRM